MHRVFSAAGALAIGLPIAFVLAHCSTGGASAPEMPTDDAWAQRQRIATYSKDIAPILAARCQSCHVQDGIAPFALGTYAQAFTNHAAIADETLSHAMPPWGADETDTCKPIRALRDDARLTVSEIDLIQQWSQAGAPEGDPADAVSVSPVTPPALTNIAKTLPTSGYTMAASSDVMRCFILDPAITDTKYLSAASFTAGEKSVVHHALIYSDPDRGSLAHAQAAGTTDQYDCFGGPKVDSSQLLMAWAPGGVPYELPPEIGTPLTKGSLIVVQVHYHAVLGKPPTFDKSRIDLKYHDTRPQYFAQTRLLGNTTRKFANGDGIQPGAFGETKFLIAPGEVAHEETWRFTMPFALQEGYLYGAGAHMHYVGVSQELSIHRALPTNDNPENECLLAVPRYDFDWQRGYTYASAGVTTLPKLTANDELWIKCKFNNSNSNPKMSRLMRESGITTPQPVTLGEGTLDEMCLGAFVIVTPAY